MFKLRSEDDVRNRPSCSQRTNRCSFGYWEYEGQNICVVCAAQIAAQKNLKIPRAVGFIDGHCQDSLIEGFRQFYRLRSHIEKSDIDPNIQQEIIAELENKVYVSYRKCYSDHDYHID